ncbi:MAG TPA: VWA domain-containing protein [Bryobacteraceae bacterium]|nr:VWA domain-containing protein [Bryobacteraceae bacterium]
MRKLLVLFSLAGILAASDPPKQGSATQPSASGQTPDQNQKPTFAVGVKEVMAPVTVTDSDGNIVSGLTPLDFRILDNGHPQKFTEDIAVHPISLVVAVQASAQVEKILPQIRNVGSVFDTLVTGENGEMAVLAFDHTVKTMTPFTSDPDKIHKAFKDLRAGSWTFSLNDATTKALNMLRDRPSNRRRILVLISESRDNGSEMHVRDVLTEAEFADVVIYSVDISHLLSSLTEKPLPNRPLTAPPGGISLPAGQVLTPTLARQMNQNGNWTPVFKEIFTAVKAIFVPNPLEVYTKYTGGREYPFFSRRGLEQAVSDIGEELHNQYLLTYSPNDQNEAGFHEITVEVDKPGLKVRTRNGYWLAGKPK